MTVPIQFHIDITATQAMLMRAELRISPPGLATFLGAMVDPFLSKRAHDRFAGEGDDAVGQWLPLARYTQEIRQQSGYGAAHPINKRSGRLEDYIVGNPPAIRMHSVGATLIKPGSGGTGEMADKVRVAQIGSGSPPTPARPVLAMNQTDLAAILIGLKNHIEAP